MTMRVEAARSAFKSSSWVQGMMCPPSIGSSRAPSSSVGRPKSAGFGGGSPKRAGIGPLIGVRELRGDPDRPRPKSAGPDRRADVRLVAVDGRRVHVPAAGGECRLDRRLRGAPGPDLEHAEAELRNGAPVAESNRRKLGHTSTVAARATGARTERRLAR